MVEVIDTGESGTTGHLGQRDLASSGYGLVSGHLEGVVLKNEQYQVGWRGLADGDERSQTHEHAAVAVEDPHLPFGLGQGNAHGKVGRVSHGAGRRREVKRRVGQP